MKPCLESSKYKLGGRRQGILVSWEWKTQWVTLHPSKLGCLDLPRSLLLLSHGEDVSLVPGKVVAEEALQDHGMASPP